VLFLCAGGESNVPMDHRKVRTIAEELAQIESARMRKNVVYVLGTSNPGAVKARNAIKAVLLETFLAMPYRVSSQLFTLQLNSIPQETLLKVMWPDTASQHG
jgi:hypothetical protein